MHANGPLYASDHSSSPSFLFCRWRLGFVDVEHGIGVGDREQEMTWWARRPVGDLALTTPVTVTPAVTCKEAVDLLQVGATRADVLMDCGGRICHTRRSTASSSLIPPPSCSLACPRPAAPPVQSLGYDQLPVVDENSGILGVVTEGNITSRILAGRLKPGDSVSKALYAQFRRVTVTTPLFELARIFDRDHFAVVVQTQVRSRRYPPHIDLLRAAC